MYRIVFPASVAGAAALFLAAAGTSASPDHAVSIPAPAHDIGGARGDQVAVLAGGCFWGMEAVFEDLKGVKSVTSGYAGGTRATATYDQVSTEKTGHAEAVRIVYDPAKISYGTLLRVYFSVAHDPTQLNRQTPDTGPSYRSAIFPTNKAQHDTAAAYIAQLTKAKSFGKPIATRIESGHFFPAEAYHQDFARRNPTHPYIARWDRPKLAALEATFPALIR